MTNVVISQGSLSQCCHGGRFGRVGRGIEMCFAPLRSAEVPTSGAVAGDESDAGSSGGAINRAPTGVGTGGGMLATGLVTSPRERVPARGATTFSNSSFTVVLPRGDACRCKPCFVFSQ